MPAVMHELIQRLADRTADAEGEPRRAVPRPTNDLALPDQLRVIAADAMAAGAADETALALVQATRDAFFATTSPGSGEGGGFYHYFGEVVVSEAVRRLRYAAAAIRSLQSSQQ